MKIVGIIALIVFCLVGMGYCSYQVKRSWNYSMSYEGKVQDTVCEMVKPEHLTEYGQNTCK